MTSQTQWKARPAARPRPESFGVLYPKGDVVAVIDDERDAATAVQALTAAGVPTEAIEVLQSADVVRLDDTLRRRRSALEAIGALLSSLLGDDGRYQQEYADEARKGHRTLIIHGPSGALVAAIPRRSRSATRTMRAFTAPSSSRSSFDAAGRQPGFG